KSAKIDAADEAGVGQAKDGSTEIASVEDERFGVASKDVKENEESEHAKGLIG
ncbi:16289_t:CDS:1, partial [Gigaspora rosea]